VVARLTAEVPELRCEIEVVKTMGDHLQTASGDVGKLAKGLFTKEIEEALLERRADFAVHSLKDLPVDGVEGLVIGAVPMREDPRDVLLLKEDLANGPWPDGTVILTGSPRRTVQWRLLYPGTVVESVRGNIDTRLRKLREGTAGGLILAAAGLHRLSLDLSGVARRNLEGDEMVPAPGQGALGLQCRSNDELTRAILAKVNDEFTRWETSAERHFLKMMGGGCLAPLGCLGRIDREDRTMVLRAAWADEVNGPVVRADVKGSAGEGEALAEELAELIRRESLR
jgi:hydroxymethylbilane synthase